MLKVVKVLQEAEPGPEDYDRLKDDLRKSFGRDRDGLHWALRAVEQMRLGNDECFTFVLEESTDKNHRSKLTAALNANKFRFGVS